MAKGKLLKAGAKKLTKKAGIKKTVKKAKMKKAPNFDKFKQTRGFPTEGKYAMTKAKPTKQLAGEAYKKQKEKQKKYYDKKTESKRK